MNKIKYFENYMLEITDTIDNGTLDEVVALAKEYNINTTNIRVPSRQNDVVELLKQRLTVEKFDWTTI